MKAPKDPGSIRIMENKTMAKATRRKGGEGRRPYRTAPGGATANLARRAGGVGRDRSSGPQALKKIVIVGDWFIDENWLVSKHLTYSSTHTGDAHYLSKHTKIDKRMISLCGASEILEVLRWYFEDSYPGKYEFLGYGAWNIDDDKILQCILCSEHLEKKHLTPYTITSLKQIRYRRRNREHIRLCPYSKNGQQECIFNPRLINLAGDQEVSTNRIVRRYEGVGSGKPILKDRVDWMLPAPCLNYDFVDLEGSDVSAVILEDHGEGVINPTIVDNLITALGDNSRNILWYVRSKLDNPDWMTILYKNKIKIRLKVVDNKLAEHKKGTRRWFLGNEIGHASLELLGELTGDTVYKHSNEEHDLYENHTTRTAVLFDDNTAIAKDGSNCFVLSTSLPQQLINIGRTTTFFNALIAQDLMDPDRDSNDPRKFGIQCGTALKCAYEWSIASSEAWSREDFYFYGDYRKALKRLYKETIDEKAPESVDYYGDTLKSTDYQIAWQRWNKSAEGCGVLEIRGKEIFQLWRGEGALEGFITVGSPKRDAINDLMRKIHQFESQKKAEYPFNSLLIASPGWGKSFLAKCLAKHFDMHYLEFSISELATSRDLIDCFDTICSVQNRGQRKVLIFIDEINCEIEGHSIMGLLLSPIWDGTFIRDGKTYRLQPAVWIFASTDPISQLVRPSKGSDFISRLNGPIVELDYLATEGDKTFLLPLKELRTKLVAEPSFSPYNDPDYVMFARLPGAFRTEQVYLGVYLLDKIWGPLSAVQRDVLQLFHDILAINGFRSLEFFIAKFENVTRGEVFCSNVPEILNYPELRRHIVFPEAWAVDKKPDDDRNRLVSIEAGGRRNETIAEIAMI